jgi:hypothetical protein
MLLLIPQLSSHFYNNTAKHEERDQDFSVCTTQEAMHLLCPTVLDLGLRIPSGFLMKKS